MYKLEVSSDSRNGYWSKSCWHNYIKHIRNITAEGELLSEVLFIELDKIGAKKSLFQGYIEFETEEDATAFVLKWS